MVAGGGDWLEGADKNFFEVKGGVLHLDCNDGYMVPTFIKMYRAVCALKMSTYYFM